MTTTIPELVKSRFNIDVKLLNKRFNQDGWELEGESAVVCTDCDHGTRLVVFRKPYKSSGKFYKYWCVVCLTCKEAAALSNYDSESQKLISKSSIAELPWTLVKFEPKCTHSHSFGNCPNVNCPKKLTGEQWTEGWSLSWYGDNQVYKCKYGRFSLNERLVVAKEIFAVLDNFIDTYYGKNVAPFDVCITPVSHAKKSFELTNFLAEELQGKGISNQSHALTEKTKLPPMKNIGSEKQRRSLLEGNFRLTTNAQINKASGFLLLDDVFDTGSTLSTIARLINSKFPEKPVYVIAISRLHSWDGTEAL